MRQTRRNPQEFDCEQCGNPLMKSRVRDSVKCRWCGYVNTVGKFDWRGSDGNNTKPRSNKGD